MFRVYQALSYHCGKWGVLLCPVGASQMYVDAQVRGNVPKVRIATWSKEKKERSNIETVNPQVRSLIRQSTQINETQKK